LKKPTLLLCFLLASISVCSQKNAKLDSIKRVVYNSKTTDSVKTYAYVNIIRYYRRNDLDSCKHYMNELLQLAETKNNPLAYHKYHFLLTSYYGFYLQPEEDAYTFIQSNLLEAKRYAELGGRPDLVSLVYTRLVPENFRFGKEELALQYSFEGEQVAIKNEQWGDLGYLYGQVGKIYNLGFKNTEQSLRYLLKSDSVFTSLNRKSSQWGFTLSFIGDVYETLEDYDNAEVYQTKALDIFEEKKDQYQQSYIKGKLAQLEKRKGNYQKAVQLITESTNYYRNNNYPLQLGGSLVLESNIYSQSGQIEKALESGQEAIEINKQHKSSLGTIMALINQSQVLSNAKRYSESNVLARQAEPLAIKQNSYQELQQIYEVLIENSEKEAQYQNAFQYTKELQAVNDTLTKRKNLIVAKDLEAKYQTNQKEQEIALLQSKNDLVEAKQRNQQYLLWGIAIFSLIGLITLYLLYRNRQKTNQRLKELDLAKTSFFQNISHEFRTPLSLIYGPIERILSENKLSEREKSDLQLMQRSTHRLNELVDQILDVSKLEANQWQLRVSEINVSSLLKSITASFQFQAEQKNLDFTVDISEINTVWLDKDVIEKIASNLLSNAIKYTPSEGNISFKAFVMEENIHLQVENSGGHFSEKEMRLLFDRFVRLESTSMNVGTGIGLALVQQLVNLCNGSIAVNNIQEDHVLFEVSLPVKKSAYKPHQIIHVPDFKEISNQALQTLDENSEKPVLLIVDDHPDIREFIQTSFQQSYQVLEASDGALGLNTALTTIPDIIISDVMMPELSGTELCKQLKEDERTSHIPIILLSAKDDIESNYLGIEVGADDYMAKPFSYKLLKSKLQNLIESRAKLRARYSKEVVLRPTEISINSADERFIERVKEVLDAHLADDTFTVEKFSEVMTMSRMQLHRKLKALTGLTTSEFLRTERLKVAAVLLKDPSLNINEIGYQVGFSSPSYFTKCFKEVYGMLPSEYQRTL